MTRVQEKERLPPAIFEAHENLEDYLSTLKDTNREHEDKILRYKKSFATRRYNEAIKQQQKGKITVTSLTKDNKPPKAWNKKVTTEETRRVDICKTGTTAGASTLQSNVVVETRKGLKVNCNHCGHSFVHYSKNLYSQYFCTCSRCHLNVRLRHYKIG